MRLHKLRRAVPALLLGALAAGCSDILEVDPVNDIPDDVAIVDAPSARAALAGAYDALQAGGYFGGDFAFFGDLPSDAVIHTGTFDTYLELDQNRAVADNGSIEDMWEDIYAAINRANVLIQKLPDVADLPDDERQQMLGEADFLRALHYHNLVKFFGGVPLRLEPIVNPGEGEVVRATVEETYAQIVEDIDAALANLTDDESTTRASIGAAWALRSRVLLYTGDWDGVVAAADEVEALGYDLAPTYEELFIDDAGTDEDIFRLEFTAVDFNNNGYYYLLGGGGRREVAPSIELMCTYDPALDCSDLATVDVGLYAPTDARGQYNITVSDADQFGSKFPTSEGGEDLHVIRFAEVLLNRAEAYARLDMLAEAVDDYNRTRVRAGLAPHELGVTVVNGSVLDTRDEVLEQIWLERLKELAYEGDRWPDLVRTGRAAAVLGLEDDELYQLLFPIPVNEVDISGIDQNPGY